MLRKKNLEHRQVQKITWSQREMGPVASQKDRLEIDYAIETLERKNLTTTWLKHRPPEPWDNNSLLFKLPHLCHFVTADFTLLWLKALLCALVYHILTCTSRHLFGNDSLGQELHAFHSLYLYNYSECIHDKIRHEFFVIAHWLTIW